MFEVQPLKIRKIFFSGKFPVVFPDDIDVVIPQIFETVFCVQVNGPGIVAVYFQFDLASVFSGKAECGF